MNKEDIFNISMPSNDKIRHYLGLKYLKDVYENTKTFDKIAAKISSKFQANYSINAKIEKNDAYLEVWMKLCNRMFYYLLGPAKFFDRKDIDSLVCLPICCKISINGSNCPTWAMNIYDSEKRIMTIFHKDPEFGNEYSFYTDKLLAHGSWVGEVRTAVQQLNSYGFSLDIKENKQNKASIDDSFYTGISSSTELATYGNTITVHDIFNKISLLKEKLSAMNNWY